MQLHSSHVHMSVIKSRGIYISPAYIPYQIKLKTYIAAMTCLHASLGTLLPCVPFMQLAGSNQSECRLTMTPIGTDVEEETLISRGLQLGEGSDKAGCQECAGILAQMHSIPEDMLSRVGADLVGIPL